MYRREWGKQTNGKKQELRADAFGTVHFQWYSQIHHIFCCQFPEKSQGCSPPGAAQPGASDGAIGLTARCCGTHCDEQRRPQTYAVLNVGNEGMIHNIIYIIIVIVIIIRNKYE